MSKSKRKNKKTTGRNRRVSLTTLLLAALVLAAASVTVISRQRARAAERQTQMAEKTNFVKAAHQDAQLTAESPDLTAEEAQKLAAGLKDLVNQSTEGLSEVKHADGSSSVDLQGRFQNVTVAKINKDGSISQSCVDNPKAAGAFFGIDPKLIDKNAGTTGAKPAKTNPKTRN